MNRFFVPISSFEDDRVRLSPEQGHQVCHVLRLKPGDRIVVLDGSGMEYEVALTATCPPETVGHVLSRRPAPGEPRVQIVLFQSLLAREKFEWVLQKATEVGVTRFVPVLTERSIVRAKRIEERKLLRWRRILVEAAEQSHRGRVPRLDQAVGFDEALSRLADLDGSVIAAPSKNAASLREALRGVPPHVGSVALLIGPEGGFTDEEVARACQRGAVPVGLGPRILRTETAAVVASALVLHELGEMESPSESRI